MFISWGVDDEFIVVYKHDSGVTKEMVRLYIGEVIGIIGPEMLNKFIKEIESCDWPIGNGWNIDKENAL